MIGIMRAGSSFVTREWTIVDWSGKSVMVIGLYDSWDRLPFDRWVLNACNHGTKLIVETFYRRGNNI